MSCNISNVVLAVSRAHGLTSARAIGWLMWTLSPPGCTRPGSPSGHRALCRIDQLVGLLVNRRGALGEFRLIDMRHLERGLIERTLRVGLGFVSDTFAPPSRIWVEGGIIALQVEDYFQHGRRSWRRLR
jgi:hypothetical protein